MRTRTAKLLKEVSETNVIADRIVTLASKQKKAATEAVGAPGKKKGPAPRAKTVRTKKRPGMAQKTAKSA